MIQRNSHYTSNMATTTSDMMQPRASDGCSFCGNAASAVGKSVPAAKRISTSASLIVTPNQHWEFMRENWAEIKFHPYRRT